MANLQASIKALRQTQKKTVYNNRIKNRYKKAVKSYTEAVEAGDEKTAKPLLERVYKMLDKAAQKGVLKQTTAARKKSRLAMRLNNLSAQDVEAADSNS